MNFIKNGLFNVFIYGAGLTIVNGLSFLMLPFYTHHFAPQDYALITLVLSCLPFTRYCLPLEICQAAPVFSSDDEAKAPIYVSVGFWFAILMNLICYLLAFMANTIFHFIPYSSYSLLSVFALLAVDCLFYYSSNIMRWQLKPYLYNVIISGVAISEVILTILFIMQYKLSIIGVFYAWLISRSAGFIFMYYFTKNYYLFTFNIKTLKTMLSFSFPLVLSNLAYNVNRSFDRWIIVTMMGLSAVGIYGAGATIGGVINFIMASVSAALSPIIYKDHNKQEAPVEIVKLFYMVITACMTVAMIFAIFNKDIIHLLVSEAYFTMLTEHAIVPIIVLTAIISGLSIFAPGIQIAKKTKYVVLINICSLTTNILLSFLLIKKLGIVGIAFATCVSVIINTLLYIMTSQRYYKLPFHNNYLMLLIVVFMAFYVGAIFINVSDSYIIRSVYCLLFALFSWQIVWKIVHLSANTNDMKIYGNQHLLRESQ